MITKIPIQPNKEGNAAFRNNISAISVITISMDWVASTAPKASALLPAISVALKILLWL